ncbi:MAG: agmatinase family protein [Cyclobacteriaceae bacterium]|nr:agmatinase family protein [Cyclobacteriaceae bacterium]
MDNNELKNKLIFDFDPNSVGVSGKLFGLPFDETHSEIVLIPVPWEVTVSYSAGTADGPEAILNASTQVDLHVNEIPEAWKLGISMLPIPEDLKNENNKYRDLAAKYIRFLENNEVSDSDEEMKVIPQYINEVCEKLNIYVESTSKKLLKENKMVGVVGGDHSTPLGLIRALAKKHDSFGILQIDAHADLRKAYENFVYSHASIMFNALKLSQVKSLVQVGIRDLCEEEDRLISSFPKRIITYFDKKLKESVYKGNNWDKITDSIISKLPGKVYISFDIDGLSPLYCPNTGTPVPGGLDFQEAVYLIKKVALSGRKIIGFDLNEVAPGQDEWDANVGARLLYELCNWMAVSQQKLATTAQ